MKKILCVSFLIFTLLLNLQVHASNIYSGDTIYMTKKGDTIEAIASQFHLTPSVIYEINSINQKQPIEGVKLIIPTSKNRPKTEISECHGRFDNKFDVRIVVNWNSNTIKVNGMELKINNVLIDKGGNGVTSTSYINKLGYFVYYYIVKANPPYQGDFAIQVDSMTRRVITFTPLFCNKSFDRPFMERMLS